MTLNLNWCQLLNKHNTVNDIIALHLTANIYWFVIMLLLHICSTYFKWWNWTLAWYFMEDKRYQGLEKKFHLLQDKHLRELSAENGVSYGSAAVICKAIIDKVCTLQLIRVETFNEKLFIKKRIMLSCYLIFFLNLGWYRGSRGIVADFSDNK